MCAASAMENAGDSAEQKVTLPSPYQRTILGIQKPLGRKHKITNKKSVFLCYIQANKVMRHCAVIFLLLLIILVLLNIPSQAPRYKCKWTIL